MQIRTDSSEPSPPDQLKVPQHVAIIMDGNGRWAKKRGLPRLAGHRVGVDCIQRVLETLTQKGVRYVTVFAFSTENWNRPAEEVEGIIELLHNALRQQTQTLHEKNVRIVHVGQVDRLSPALRQEVEQAQELTRNNDGAVLNVAFNYGGRSEIIEAVRICMD